MHYAFVRPTNKGPITSTVVDNSLMTTCREGPAVSLNGSPTVSPVTAADSPHPAHACTQVSRVTRVTQFVQQQQVSIGSSITNAQEAVSGNIELPVTFVSLAAFAAVVAELNELLSIILYETQGHGRALLRMANSAGQCIQQNDAVHACHRLDDVR
jgi:hypothetical protein